MLLNIKPRIAQIIPQWWYIENDFKISVSYKNESSFLSHRSTGHLQWSLWVICLMTPEVQFGPPSTYKFSAWLLGMSLPSHSLVRKKNIHQKVTGMGIILLSQSKTMQYRYFQKNNRMCHTEFE